MFYGNQGMGSRDCNFDVVYSNLGALDTNYCKGTLL